MKNLTTIFVGYANQKGGCGKTTLTQLNAKALAYKGYKVLIIECDFQKSLSNTITTLEEVAKEKNLDFKPPYEILFSEVTGVEEEAKKAIDKYDYVFIDMPGTLDKNGITNMLTVADLLIIPIAIGQYDLESTLTFLETAQKVKEYKEKHEIPFKVKFLINKDDKQLKESKQLKNLLEELEIERFDTIIKHSINYIRHQSKYTNPLEDKTIRFEYGNFIEEFIDLSNVLLEEINKTTIINN